MSVIARQPAPQPAARHRLDLRVVPLSIRQIRTPQRLLERQWLLNRSGQWTILLSGFFEPVFYLLSIRVGFGALIGDVTDGSRTLSYAAFVAPAMMASSAMNGAIYESTMNIFAKLRYAKVYDSMLATPLGVGDVAVGETLYATFRGAIYSTAFLVTMVALGLVPSWWSVLAIPACVLISFAFSAVGMAATTYMRTWNDIDYVQTVMLPLFLFSATFYPLSSYGRWDWVVQLSPLYHGVAVVRAAVYGDGSWALLAHLAVLITMMLVGIVVTARRLERLLLK